MQSKSLLPINDPLENSYPKNVAKWLALIQITLGLGAMVLFVIAIVICRVLGILNVTVPIFFVVSGIFNLISAKTSHRNILVAVTTTSTLSTIAAGSFLRAATYGTLIRSQGVPVPYMFTTWEILQGTLMIVCLLEGILSIVFLTLACQTLCSCCKTQVFVISNNSETSAVEVGNQRHRSLSNDPSCQINNNHIRSNSTNENETFNFQEYHPPPPDYKDVV